MKCLSCGGEASTANPIIEYTGRRTGSVVMLHRVCWVSKVMGWVEQYLAIAKEKS